MEFNPDTGFIHSSTSLSSVPELSRCGAASDSGFLQRGRSGGEEDGNVGGKGHSSCVTFFNPHSCCDTKSIPNLQVRIQTQSI